MHRLFHREDVLESPLGHDDEATLIHIRYALADLLELCQGLSPSDGGEVLALEQMISAASVQAMFLLKSQQKTPIPTLPTAA
jgi:hypothetical protein